jgi:hypothetical protein
MNQGTANDPRDEWIAAVFRSRAEDSQLRNDCPSPERIWDAVRLQMRVDERLEVVDHISVCSTCAEAWSLAAEVERALDATEQPQVNASEVPAAAMAPPSLPVSALYGRRPLFLAAAAVLLVALGIVFMIPRQAVPPREATHSPLPTPAPQPVQATQNPVAPPTTDRPSPAASVPPTVVETPDLVAAREQLARELARARAQTLAGPHAEPATATRDTSPSSPVGSDAPVSGWISVNVPVNMQIYENQRLLGSSQTDRIMVSVGRHELEVVNEALGYRATKIVNVARDQTASIKIDLPKAPMALNALPWAQVWIDGVRVGETPIGSVLLSIGPHEVVFRHPVYGERRSVINVTLPGPTKVAVDMRKE